MRSKLGSFVRSLISGLNDGAATFLASFSSCKTNTEF